MKKFTLLFTLLLSIFMITVTFTGTANNQTSETHVNSTLSLSSTKQPHQFLEITNNIQLDKVASDEGWKGEGTESNPYRISGYRFEEGVNGSSFFDDYEKEHVYLEGGFTTYNLIIRGISEYIVIENNEFTFSVLISSRGQHNVQINSNQWVNDHYSSNLFVVGKGISITDNAFHGSNDFCPSDASYLRLPRVFVDGYQHKIIHNTFSVDTGCTGISQLSVKLDHLVDTASPEIAYNKFEPSDIALDAHGAFIVHNNDFDIGDFAIIMNSQYGIVKENNFYSSEIGIQGKQTYSGMIWPYAEYFYERGATHRSSNCGIRNSDNYYEFLDGTDINNDGYIDQGLEICSGDGKFDVYPSFHPNPAYDAYNKDTNNLESLRIIVGITSLVIMVTAIFRLYNSTISLKPVYEGELTGKSAEIVKELFKSQTILYYTLIGQSKITDEELESNVKKAVPSNFLEYRFLFHPVKLAIVKLLYENLEFTSIELKNILEISWNDFHTHASALRKKGYIRMEDEFVMGVKRQMLRIEDKGIQEYKTMIDLLHLFLDNSTDYKLYIDTAQKRMESINRDLYPDG